MSHIFLELERTTVIKTLINNIVDIKFLKEKDGGTSCLLYTSDAADD